MADVGDSSSEDEAPEQVTFQRGREEAAQNQKREKQAAQREKALLKEKRRRREELFKEQKYYKSAVLSFINTGGLTFFYNKQVLQNKGAINQEVSEEQKIMNKDTF